MATTRTGRMWLAGVLAWLLASLLAGCLSDTRTRIGASTGGEDAGPPDADCSTDADCARLSSDPQCTHARCLAGRCELSSRPDGFPCDDGNPGCTHDDSCVAGVCVGQPVACESNDPCIAGTCEPDAGCAFRLRADGEACDDGAPCTVDDACFAGMCVGQTKPCPDTQCAKRACDGSTGECAPVTTYAGIACDDANVCTDDDVCHSDGSCVGEWVCDDGNVCTDDQCDPDDGCAHIHIEGCCSTDAECWDEDPCTDGYCDTTSGTCQFPPNGLCCASDDDCDHTGVCLAGLCAPAGTPNEYGYPRPATWISTMAFGGVGETEDCCFDLNGDNQVDNAVGMLVEAISGLVGSDYSAQDWLQAQIDEGAANYLLVYDANTLAGMPNVSPLRVDSFTPPDDGTSLATKLAGGGQWLLPADQFAPGTAAAELSFGQGSISGGSLQAGPGKCWSFPVFLGLPVLILAVPFLDSARIEAEVLVAPGGKGLDTAGYGKLGGVTRMEDFFASMNDFYASECPCVSLPGPLVTYLGEAQPPTCNDGNSASCDPTDDELCIMLNDYCNMMMIFLKPDVDSDGNGIEDAMSIGFWFTGVGAEVVGVSPN